jgi:cysteine desulfurase / selenocysteine lyase
LTTALLGELATVPKTTVYGPRDPWQQTAVVSFTVAGRDIAEVATLLDERFGILTRAGLHCSPAAHRTLGTLATGGTIRVSLGPSNTLQQVRYFGSCLRQLAAE